MPNIYVYNWKLFFKDNNYIILGSYPEIPCWKRYSQKISGYATAEVFIFLLLCGALKGLMVP